MRTQQEDIMTSLLLRREDNNVIMCSWYEVRTMGMRLHGGCSVHTLTNTSLLYVQMYPSNLQVIASTDDVQMVS